MIDASVVDATLAAVVVLVLSLAPLAIFALTLLVGRRRQRRADKPAAPAGDPYLREALAAVRKAHQEEHRTWEAEFCRLAGMRVPSAGDPYNLEADMRRLHADIISTGSLYGPDALKYLLLRSGGPHADIPECTCQKCWEARKEFFQK